MNPIIKWPGGKSGEIRKIKDLIPEYSRYIEPFFGGGALFFHLMPPRAVINDISPSLMNFYRMVQAQDKELEKILLQYDSSIFNMNKVLEKHSEDLIKKVMPYFKGRLSVIDLEAILKEKCTSMMEEIYEGFNMELILNPEEFKHFLHMGATDKVIRTGRNHKRKPFSRRDLIINVKTGFSSGCYMYFRKVFNDIQLGRITAPSQAYETANFYFIREYCYGSMFRYNSMGEFNIPYGGLSYTNKNLRFKIGNIFNPQMEKLFRGAEIHCQDFEAFLQGIDLSDKDFLFIDPPYDTDFSDYEGNDFTREDQKRLAEILANIPAKFILIIKNTEFIYNLYKDNFRIFTFDYFYTYNVRSRNNRSVEHLVITNLPE